MEPRPRRGTAEVTIRPASQSALGQRTGMANRSAGPWDVPHPYRRSLTQPPPERTCLYRGSGLVPLRWSAIARAVGCCGARGAHLVRRCGRVRADAHIAVGKSVDTFVENGRAPPNRGRLSQTVRSETPQERSAQLRQDDADPVKRASGIASEGSVKSVKSTWYESGLFQ